MFSFSYFPFNKLVDRFSFSLWGLRPNNLRYITLKLKGNVTHAVLIGIQIVSAEAIRGTLDLDCHSYIVDNSGFSTTDSFLCTASKTCTSFLLCSEIYRRAWVCPTRPNAHILGSTLVFSTSVIFRVWAILSKLFLPNFRYLRAIGQVSRINFCRSIGKRASIL